MKTRQRVKMIVGMALVGFVASFGLSGCGGEPAGTFEPETAATTLKAEVAGWDQWKQHKDFSGIQAAKDPFTHGKYVAIYMNDTAAGAQGNLSGSFPDGSVFVKRGYDDADGKTPKTWITIFKKIAGSDPANGDWFSMRLTDDGSMSMYKAADKGGCMGCHSSAKDSHDYIRFLKDESITF